MTLFYILFYILVLGATGNICVFSLPWKVSSDEHGGYIDHHFRHLQTVCDYPLSTESCHYVQVFFFIGSHIVKFLSFSYLAGPPALIVKDPVLLPGHRPHHKSLQIRPYHRKIQNRVLIESETYTQKTHARTEHLTSSFKINP